MKPIVMSETQSIVGTKYVETYQFKSDHKVPIYEVYDSHGLNQIIGYIKLLNREYGKVYYRGQCNLHDTMLPSLYHESQSPNFINNRNYKLNKIIEAASKDCSFLKEINREIGDESLTILIEGVLQHYGINTHCIDAVDNHWIAIWFGLHKYQCEVIKGIKYARYIERYQNAYQLITNEDILDGKLTSMYQYILLIAAENGVEEQGINRAKTMTTVDLRTALPSTFLRPHAQHGVVLKRKPRDSSSNYDLSENVVGILKIRIDLARKWLGDGELVRFNNLFPSQFRDFSYRILLERDDLFSDDVNSIVRYTYE